MALNTSTAATDRTQCALPPVDTGDKVDDVLLTEVLTGAVVSVKGVAVFAPLAVVSKVLPNVDKVLDLNVCVEVVVVSALGGLMTVNIDELVKKGKDMIST
jgi:hypothetical protein